MYVCIYIYIHVSNIQYKHIHRVDSGTPTIPEGETATPRCITSRCRFVYIYIYIYIYTHSRMHIYLNICICI